MADMENDMSFVLTRSAPGSINIDVHPTEKALVVNYVLEATIHEQTGCPMIGEARECQSIIRVRNLTAETDIRALTKDIIAKCRLITAGNALEIEQLLYYLQTRKDAPESSQSGPLKKLSGKLNEPKFDSTKIEEIANLYHIEHYLELLYEDVPEKIRGTGLILQLAQNPDNLGELFTNETLVGALARVLREDWKKSTALAINIVHVFFHFSIYPKFHAVIVHFKIGSLCMSIIEHEIKKHALWVDELAAKKKQMEESGDTIMKKRYEKSEKQFQELLQKQEDLLLISFYLLLNLSAEIPVERKIRNKGVVQLLVKTLERDNFELLSIVVFYLKKLSIFIENKTDMANGKIIEKLAKLVPCEHEDLLNFTLRLLLNLSFDKELRSKMIKTGMLPRLVELLKNENHYRIVLCILYHISLDDKAKSMFIFTECIPIVMVKLLKSNEQPEVELMALCINLASNKRCAELICKNNGLRYLMKQAFKLKNPVVMKMIRHLSQHDGPTKTHFIDFIGNITEVVVSKDENPEFLLETLRILGNLTIPDLDYELLMTEYNLVPWIKTKLQMGIMSNAHDDFVLAVVVLMGTICNDDACAKLMSQEGLVEILIELLNAKQEDDEMVLQIVYVFYQMIFHEATREVIIKKTLAPAYLIDLMHDKNSEIVKICGRTTDIISEYDEGWAERIRLEKFRWHNSQWLEMVKSRAIEEEGYNYDEDAPHYNPSYIQDTAVLDNPNMFYGIPEGCDPALMAGGQNSPVGAGQAEYMDSHADGHSAFHDQSVYDVYARAASHAGPGMD